MIRIAVHGPFDGRYGHQVHEARASGTHLGHAGTPGAGQVVRALFEGSDLELPVWFGLVG